MTKRSVNKTTYILKFGNLAASEIVKKAKKEGIKLSEKYIYSTRSKAKKTGDQRSSKVNGRGSKSTEEAFLNAALDLGLGKAEQLLKNIRQAAATATS